MRATTLLLLLACILTLLLLESCATTARIPTVSFTQYGLEPGPSQNQTKSDIDISLKVIRMSDVYDYPELFSFNIDDFPQYKNNYYLENAYRKGPLGKRWANFFSSSDGSQQLLLCWVKIRNNTKHILRMRDARVYMVIEGQEPITALSSYQELVSEAQYFEDMYRREWEARVLKIGEYPSGISRAFLSLKRNYYKLINDISKEILPGFTYEGMLVFPVVPSVYGAAKISFFDVTTKTDAAGNPVEKTQFDFSLQPQRVQMWFDRTESKWKSGTPPAQATQ